MKKRELIVVFFIVTLLISNIMATKMISVGPLVLPAAVIIFPFCFMLGDVLTEIWGYRYTKKVILTGFGANLLMTVFLYLGQLLPPASFWQNQGAYEAIFGMVPRIVLASFAAYLVGELLNSLVMDKMKRRSGEAHLYRRTILSTVVGQIFDSGIFITVAFYGTMPNSALLTLLIGQYLAKVVIEAVLGTPLAYWLVGMIRRSGE